MDVHPFQKVIEGTKRYLTYDKDIEFVELIEEAKKNERIRNLCVFYSLKTEENFRTFLQKANNDPAIEQMLKDLHSALRIPGVNYSEVREFARMLRGLPYYASVAERLDTQIERTPASREMAKFLQNIVWQIRKVTQKKSERKQQYIQEKMMALSLPKR